jgi:hypothetical protein
MASTALRPEGSSACKYGRQIWYHKAFPTKDGRHAVDWFVYRPGEIAQCDLWFPKPEIPVGAGQQRAGLFEPCQAVGHNDDRRLTWRMLRGTGWGVEPAAALFSPTADSISLRCHADAVSSGRCSIASLLLAPFVGRPLACARKGPRYRLALQKEPRRCSTQSRYG